MYDSLKHLMKDEIEEEVDKATTKGIEQGRLQSIRELMKNLKFSAEQALDALGIPKSEHQKYIQML